MKLLTVQAWEVVGIVNDLICVKSLRYRNEYCLVERFKMVDQDTNESWYYSIVEGEISKTPPKHVSDRVG